MANALSTQFVRFAMVGAVGFAVDAGILTLLVARFDCNVYAARCVSFAAAVLTTWSINRRWTFGTTAASDWARSGIQGLRYFIAQSIGSLANLVTFFALIRMLPDLAASPVIPLTFGAIVGLIVNFVGARNWVFTKAS